jgi:hypothetical protein
MHRGFFFRGRELAAKHIGIAKKSHHLGACRGKVDATVVFKRSTKVF